MNKIAIFNVGGAFSSYLEFNDQKVIIDLGAGNGFSPVNDFLIKLFEIRKLKFNQNNSHFGRYYIDQVFLSHLDKDHISDFEKFDKFFYTGLLTSPNDNPNQLEIYRVNRSLLGQEYSVRTMVLDQMRKRTTSHPGYPDLSQSSPLISGNSSIALFYITPNECETNHDLSSGYQNNISLVLYIMKDDKTLLLPGDLLKSGVEYLIDRDRRFKHILETYGVDYLIAPHHGLQTSFSQELFNTINGKKSRLNIISEKTRPIESSESRSNVDSRYYSKDYSTGLNTLGQNAVKTSNGHIIIDFDQPETVVKQINNNDDLLKEFL